ncbi:GNAT family N-acetyltransferase [Desulfosporosinus burensis]
MTIKAYHSLSERVLNEVLNLENVCLDYDNLKGSLFLDPSLNFDQTINSFHLYYKKGELISMISMFIPTRQEAEISAYTLPKFRENGYFKALLANAVEELRKFQIPDILFVCEKPSISGKKVLAALNAEYEHTEYFMRFNKSRYAARETYRLLWRKAELKDLEKTITTSMRIFDDSYEDAKSLLEKCFESETREQHLVFLNDEIVGIGSANIEGEDVSIFGLGLIPEYRGQGYGNELLHLIIDDLLQRGRTDLTIEVNSENANALGLYQKTGFYIEVAYEYHRKKVCEIR